MYEDDAFDSNVVSAHGAQWLGGICANGCGGRCVGTFVDGSAGC